MNNSVSFIKKKIIAYVINQELINDPRLVKLDKIRVHQLQKLGGGAGLTSNKLSEKTTKRNLAVLVGFVGIYEIFVNFDKGQLL